MDVRAAQEGEIDQLARLWYDAWQDAHLPIVPPELTRLRTLESFKQRLEPLFPISASSVPSVLPLACALSRTTSSTNCSCRPNRAVRGLRPR